MEAKYMAIWIKTLIKELRIKIRSIPIYGDNQGSIFIASNAVQESRTKHIDIHYHYICELVNAKEVELQFMPGGWILLICSPRICRRSNSHSSQISYAWNSEPNIPR